MRKEKWKVFRIGTVRYNWPMSAHASQAFSIAHCTDSEDLPEKCQKNKTNTEPNPTTNPNPKPTIDKAPKRKELNKVP